MIEASHRREVEQLKDVVRAEAKAEAEQEMKGKFLVLSKFLRYAAHQRSMADPDPMHHPEETKASEAVLMLVYGGSAGAVAAISKLVEGVEEQVLPMDATEALPVTCKPPLLYLLYKAALTLMLTTCSRSGQAVLARPQAQPVRRTGGRRRRRR